MGLNVRIVEVSLRDGLQYESKILEPSTRFNLTKRLLGAGLRNIEVGAFVSPKKVPQMRGTDQVVAKLEKARLDKAIPSDSRFSALVPNGRGMKDAVKSGIREVAIFTAASKTFTLKNINCTPKESLKRFEPVMKLAKENGIKVRGYLSTCFGCPYEGKVPMRDVLRLAESLLELGVYELSIGDTIGVATPKQVGALLYSLFRFANPRVLAMHFHDTRGTAIANVLSSLDSGIRTFDTSIGGLGGCPFAPGAQGNVATEDVIYMLNGMGFKTGIDLEKLIKINHWMGKKFSHELPAKLSKAGVPWWQK